MGSAVVCPEIAGLDGRARESGETGTTAKGPIGFVQDLRPADENGCVEQPEHYVLDLARRIELKGQASNAV